MMKLRPLSKKQHEKDTGGLSRFSISQTRKRYTSLDTTVIDRTKGAQLKSPSKNEGITQKMNNRREESQKMD